MLQAIRKISHSVDVIIVEGLITYMATGDGQGPRARRLFTRPMFLAVNPEMILGPINFTDCEICPPRLPYKIKFNLFISLLNSGNMITDLDLFEELDHILFLTIAKDECRIRRMQRIYDPPDEKG
jgi:hypothetical protein